MTLDTWLQQFNSLGILYASTMAMPRLYSIGWQSFFCTAI
jgi:hypothetical protein